MTLTAAAAVTETLPPVPSQADTGGMPIRPVFVDDDGRRKRLMVRAGYLAVASFVAYLVVIGLSLIERPSGPLDGTGSFTVGAPPTHSSTPSSVSGAAPTKRRAAAADPDAAPVVAPTPAAVRLLAAPAPIRRVRTSASLAPPDRAVAPSRRPRDTDGRPTTTSNAAVVTRSPPSPATTHPTTTTATATAAR